MTPNPTFGVRTSGVMCLERHSTRRRSVDKLGPERVCLRQ